MSPSPKTQSFIHYDPERVDYAVTKEQIEQLRSGGQNHWKDVCLVSASLGIPCLINAVAETRQQGAFQLTLSMFLNYLFGVLGIALAICFGIAWWKTKRKIDNLIDSVKQQPKLRLTPEALDVGELPAGAQQQRHEP